MRIRIDHDPVPAEQAAMIHRTAVRAVIRRDQHLLLVHSTVGGDYKFPGGGLEPGESPDEALVREVSEECGRAVTSVGEVLVTALEHRQAREPGAFFRMESTYVACDVDDEVHGQSLDDYESELAFEPVWSTPDAAIAANEQVLSEGAAQTWVERETTVLRVLRDLLDWR